MTLALDADQAPGEAGVRIGRLAVLFAGLACAACGLVYELALIAVGGYLVGGSIHDTSVVLGVFVFAMGLGALAAKRLVRWPVVSFAVVEGALGLFGGLSVMVLYASFAWLGIYRPVVVALSLLLGALIGAEIPVLVTMLQRAVKQDAPAAVADLFAADYLGALIGGLAFPFVLLPTFGLLRGALLAGAVNVACAALVLGLSRRSVPHRGLLGAGAALLAVLGVLGGAAALTASFEISGRQELYEDPIVHAERSRYQEVVLTRSLGRHDLRLFLNGDLQFASSDEYRYHEALVHPAMPGRRSRVLVMGGGDGLALREILRYSDVRAVTLVELDPAVVRLATNDRRMRDLNRAAFTDPRVRVINADAFSWVRSSADEFDVVIADFPDPEEPGTAKLYSQEFYGMLDRHIAPGGRLVVQAGSPHFAREAFWCIERTIAAAGWATSPYQVDVPSFGNWGFVLARRSASPLRLVENGPQLRSLDSDVLAAATVFAPDRGPVDVDVSTLLDPAVLDYERRGWRDY